jgi:DNA mismatch endonuclease (patch repair protein)
VPGKPDFFFPASHLAVFVDGCFWHGCVRCAHPFKTRSSFWNAKIERNKERDRQLCLLLKRRGICAMRLWEHELKEDLQRCVARIKDKMTQNAGT